MELNFNRKIECIKDVMLGETQLCAFNKGKTYSAVINSNIFAINNLNLVQMIGDVSGECFNENFRVVSTELIEGAIYICSDNLIRRLNKVAENLIYYSTPIGIAKNRVIWSGDFVSSQRYPGDCYANGRLISEDDVIKSWAK